MNQALYELPLGKGKLLGGWQVNTLFNVSTGNWFTPVISGPDPSNTNTTTLRPDVNGPIPLPHTVNPWFDPSRLHDAGQRQLGQCRPRHHRGTRATCCSTSGLQKTIRLERFGALQFVASFQNVLNHTNLGEPTGGGTPLGGQTIVNNANGGKITGTHIFPPAGSPRTGQFGIRWNF